MRLKLSCREASRLLSETQDGRLRLGERLALRLHLGVCDACTRFSGQLAFLRRAMRAWPGPEAPAKDKDAG
jgi:Putative zinc-finger